ncbi:mucosa-associated lymphoid tissue lymphoma translocation protein 1-like [Antedon mediterranea]|uniref:mucosa-associated lymphoid tissue lymphoma translocation protein 1-like n=1 Tax=Antedon mediterranea TaxID=105859 RepID=UPI003AF6B2D1
MNQTLYNNYPPEPRVNPNSNIGDLNAVIIRKLISRLDLHTNGKDWRALAYALPDAPFSALDVECFANKKLENKSPAKALLSSLAGHGRTVKQLIGYLKAIGNEPALLLLQVPSEDIQIIQQPTNVTADEGEDAVFSCHGKGFPFPRYQWFKAADSEAITVENGNDRVLRINPVLPKDAGSYSCRLHNDRDDSVVSYIFTEWAELKVEKASFENLPLTLEVLKHPSSVKASVGNSICFECEVECQIAPRYQWYCIKSNLSPIVIPEKTESKLIFKQVTLEDRGGYRCKIESGREKVWTNFAELEVVPRNYYNTESELPVIVRPPVSEYIKDNEPYVLACEAYGKGPLFYQWYKDGDKIPDATGSEYRIESMKPSHYGIYMCVVCNQNGEVQSMEAVLQSPTPDNSIFALNKVALLIGNQSYRALQKLNTPQNEVEALALTLYRDCDFKVITLIDLTKEEIRTAVRLFCDLLARGMYGLFFFSGHGFENNGHSFLIPVDSTSEHKSDDCVDTQWILDQMQSRDPALNVMLLDICRMKNDYQDQKVDDKVSPQVRGNTVFGYAAGANCNAYEPEGEEYSVFAKHLLQHVKSRQRIERVLDDVKRGVQEDKTSSGQQYPTVVSDLAVGRGLRDPINSHGQTTLYNAKMQMWEDAHVIEFLPIRWYLFSNYFVNVDIGMQTSNIVNIVVFVENDFCNRFNIQLYNFTLELNVTVTKAYQPMYNAYVLTTTVSGLQKLKNNLHPDLYVEYSDESGAVLTWKRDIDFGMPLVAKIWQRTPYKQPTESAYPDFNDVPEHQRRGIQPVPFVNTTSPKEMPKKWIPVPPSQVPPELGKWRLSQEPKDTSSLPVPKE